MLLCQQLRKLTFLFVFTSSAFATENNKTQSKREMHQVEALFKKLNKVAYKKYVSNMNAFSELNELRNAYRVERKKVERPLASLEKQMSLRIKFLGQNGLDPETDEQLNDIFRDLDVISANGNRRLLEAWNLFAKRTPELSKKLLSDFENKRGLVTIESSVALMLFRGIEKVSSDDKRAIELILDIGRIPYSKVERPELRKFSRDALERAPSFDLLLFLVSGAVVANEITSID